MYTFVMFPRRRNRGENQSGSHNAGRGRHRSTAAQFQERNLCIPGGGAGVFELARRAAGVATERGAVRPVPPHGRADRRRAGRGKVPGGAGDQQLRQFRHQPRQALRAGLAGRPRHRRHDHLPRARRQVHPGRTHADGELARIQCLPRQARRPAHLRSAFAVPAGRQGGAGASTTVSRSRGRMRRRSSSG